MKVSTGSKFVNEYEMDELVSLFRMFVRDNSSSFTTSGRILDVDIINTLRYYYTDINIVDSRYVVGIDCSIWDKATELDIVLAAAREHFRDACRDGEENTVAMDDIYKYYIAHKTNDLSMSKTYVEKYIEYRLSQFIVCPGVVSEVWLEDSVECSSDFTPTL